MQNIRPGASSRVDMSIRHHFTNTPHFKAYKCLVEGVRTSESMSSMWKCRALSSSDIPEADGAKNSRQCAFSLMANRSTSAVTCRVKIIRSDTRCNFHSPWGIPLPRKSICPAVQETGDVRCSDGEKGTAPCLYRALDHKFSYKEALVIYARNHRHFVGANQFMQLFQLRP